MHENDVRRDWRGSCRGLVGIGVAALGVGLAAGLAPPAWAAHEGGDGEALVMQYLDERFRLLARQASEARSQARGYAWLAYRAARRKSLCFMSAADARAAHTHATLHAARLLGRSLEELTRIEYERLVLDAERAELVARLAASAQAAQAARAGEPEAGEPPRFSWPVVGPIVSGPGIRADGMTGVELRYLGVQILSHVNAQVLAPAAARVARVERLLEGGYALVLEHAGAYTTVLSGLREILVTPGKAIARGEIVGRVGRTLDGAPVVRFALYHGLDAQDPRRIILRPGRHPVERR